MPLVCSLLTCGGASGPMYLVAQAILAHGEGEMSEILLPPLDTVAEDSVAKLQAEAVEGRILPKSILHRYGHPSHFGEMNNQAQLGMDSVAREIDPAIRAVAHTLLPIRNGVYANEGRIISFKGLVPLGPQEGNLVAHLSGVFASGCSDREIQQLLDLQAADMDFLKMADKVSLLDYEGTVLQRATKAAKKQLGL